MISGRQLAVKLTEITKWLDQQLSISKIPDNSLNGLQVQGKRSIKKIATAVDAALETFQKAVACQADLIIVHHGLFWGQSERLVGRLYKRISILLEHGIGLYVAHLPLDLHAKWGNNIILAKELLLKSIKPFGQYHDIKIGYGGKLEKALTLSVISNRLQKVIGLEPKLLPFGKKSVKKVAIVSGGAGNLFEQAFQEGYDTFITGEFLHQDVQSARELGMNIIVGGHYATETLGVQALSKALVSKFSIQAQFLDCPTGF